MRKHILIVDDEELFREICQEMLGERGYRVSVSEDAIAALAILQSERVDLLVADITLPGMDGLSMIEQVRRSQPNLPAIVITGFLNQENMLRSLNLGVCGFLTKPFFYDELFQSVEKALENSAATRNQLLLDHYLPLIRLGEEILVQNRDSLFQRTLVTALDIALLQSGATQGFIAAPDESGVVTLAAASGFNPEDQPHLMSYLRKVQATVNIGSHNPDDGKPQDLTSDKVLPGSETLIVRLPGITPDAFLVLAHPNNDPNFSAEERKLAHLLGVQTAIALKQDAALRKSENSGGIDAATLTDLASAMVPTEAGIHPQQRAILAGLAKQLARTLGLDLATQQSVINAVLFHDLGKAFVPHNLLLKPGPLTDDEWHQVRPYVSLGAERLSRVGTLAAVAPVVAAHRERWDGDGYPNRHSGTQIPLAAAIVAVVTSWGAMQSPRPYRDALPAEMAAEELRNGSGRAFHPEVVNALLSAVGYTTVQLRANGA